MVLKTIVAALVMGCSAAAFAVPLVLQREEFTVHVETSIPCRGELLSLAQQIGYGQLDWAVGVVQNKGGETVKACLAPAGEGKVYILDENGGAGNLPLEEFHEDKGV